VKPETKFWQDHVKPNLQHFGRLKRIEDLTEKGVSDVLYCLRWLDEPPRAGWVELKRLREWPVRSSTRIFLPHYSDPQVNFLEAWGRAGMGAFLLAQVSNDFLLFKWQVAKRVQTGLLANEMRGIASVFGRGKFPTRDILRCLTTAPVQ
jgi:hypothetical protein